MTRMTKYLLFMACAFSIFSLSCSKKGCTPVQPAAEEASIKSFASKNNFIITKHNTGIYYQILDPGSDVTPTVNSQVSVTYTGQLLTSAVFDDAATPVNIDLRSVIEGWQIGLPLIKKGGHIRLLIPSSYAYGCTGKTGIPPNSVLYFDITLYDVW